MRLLPLLRTAALASLILALAGCPGFGRRPLDLPATWRTFDFHGFPFLARLDVEGDERIYVLIEGDGAPWPKVTKPPADPTPRRSVVLELYRKLEGRSRVYFGRPCQFLRRDDVERCATKWWTNARFHPDVIDSYDRALDEIKGRFRRSRLVLLGHSGGGVIATFLAYCRTDVAALVTIGAPLHVDRWVGRHRLSPLDDSLDPYGFFAEASDSSAGRAASGMIREADSPGAVPRSDSFDMPERLRSCRRRVAVAADHVRALHLVGGRDMVVEAGDVASFSGLFRRSEVRTFRDLGHNSDWSAVVVKALDSID